MSMSIYIELGETFLLFGINQIIINAIGVIYLTSMLIANTRYAYVWFTVSSQILEDRYKTKKQINKKS